MFDSEQKPIYEIFTNSHFIIPRNQRKYIWNSKNWDTLISDINFSLKCKKEHFIGSVVLKEEINSNNIKCYSVVDGQQRITTITMLLIALMFKLRFLNDSEKDIAEGIHNLLFPKNSINKEKIYFR